MLDLDRPPPFAWPEELKPIGWGDHWPEEFEPWRVRTAGLLGHLHPQIVEQWVHRHWTHNFFNFIPLDTLAWRLESWTAERLLAEVHLERDTLSDPAGDYERFHGYRGRDPIQTVTDWTDGTWPIPIIVLETPDGIRAYDGTERPDVRHVLVEGHKRMRFMNALEDRGEATGPHALLLISTPIA